MKKIFALVLVVSLVLSAFGCLPVSADNQYITNGDFENGLTGWGSSTVEGAIIEAVEGDFGNHYARLKSENGGIYIYTKDTSLQPGDMVTLSFDLRIVSLAEGASATVSIAFKDKDGKTIEKKPTYNYYENRGEWVTHKIDLKIPDNSYGLGFLLRLLVSGEVHYDNVTLTDANNETSLRVAYGDLQLDRIPDGVNDLKAKLHYVSESGTLESGNLIFAAYSGEALSAMEIVPFSTNNSVYKEVTLDLPDGAKDISVKAYVWRNGQTPEPIAESELLPKEGRSEVFDRFVTERMRGAYGANTVFYQDEDGDGNYEVMDRLAEAGINTFIFQLHYDRNGAYVGKNPEALNNAIKDLADFAAETGNMIFAKFNYGTNANATMSDYDLYHPGVTNKRNVVCPLAEGYWNAAMRDCMAVAAQYPQITGVVFDLEMYNGTGTRYNDPCFCDTCVGKFAAAYPSEEATALVGAEINSRQEFAKVSNLFADYKAWQADEITGIVSGVREYLHAINPNLILATMPGYDWLDGFVKGLGTQKMPALILEEASYAGNIAGNYKIIATMEKDGVNAVLSSGLYPYDNGEEIAPADFAAKVSEGGMVNMGYWIYAIQYLEGDPNYYPELKKGNETLDERLGLK
ncbi:MAG: carbohydrate binding domain-containing protein [Clostridia bacterium]|nr:carbohydrate binding domain-containing protein [Clostridia bacterium]